MTENRNSESIINLDEALIVTAGDREMLVSMAELFLQEGPKQLQAIHTQIQAADPQGIRDAAHTLKGSVVIFGANAAAASAAEVERVAMDKNLSGVSDAWIALEEEMKLLIGELKKLCDE